jgi:hypothetical protein
MQSSVQNKKLHEGMYDGSTTLHRMSTQKSCRMSTRQLEAPRAQRELLMTSPKPKHERLKQRPNQEVVPRLKAPDHLRQKLRQQVPQATQAHHHLLQPAPQRPNLHQSRCQRRQNHLGLLPQTNHNQHLSTRRNALIDMTYFFSSEPVTLSERPVLMMPGHYVVYSIFIDEHHKD